MLRWLTCDECSDGELSYVVDSIGAAAAPMLRESLFDTPDAYLADAERTLGLAWSRREAPLVDSQTYVQTFLSNYRTLLQTRAVSALGGLGEAAILEQAYTDRDTLGLPPGVVAALEDELARLGAGGPGFTPPAVDRILLRPDSIELQLNEETVIEGLPLDVSGRTHPVAITWSISDSTVVEPLQGSADSTWMRVRGTSPGTATVTAGVDSIQGQSIVTVVAAGAPPGRLVIVSGNGQAFTLGGPHQPLVVRVEDGNGTPITAAQVSFRAVRGATGGESFALTDSIGEARLELIPGPMSGAVWIDAAVTAAPPASGLTFQPSMVRFQLRAVEP